MPSPGMKNVDWRGGAAAEAELFPPEEEEEPFFDMLKMVCMLKGRRKPTDERRGWQNTSAEGKSYKALWQ